MDALEEKKILLKDALINHQINQETYEKMVAELDRKETELKIKDKQRSFWHSKPMNLVWRIILFIILGILFIFAVSTRLKVWWWIGY